MSKSKEIKDILVNLSPEEMELHKDLIEECLQREIEVNKHSENIKQNFDRLNMIGNKIIDDFNTIVQTTRQINYMLTGDNKKVTNYSDIDLRFIPEDEFVKA